MLETLTPAQTLEDRVLVLAPTARDGATSRTVFGEAGLSCDVCVDLPTLCAMVESDGAGVVILTEEALTSSSAGFTDLLANQPAWSDLPLLILTRAGPGSLSAKRALEFLGNVTLIERPVRVLTLISTVRSALRARRRQYQIREHLEERRLAEEALKDADRRKDEFLAMLAHELRNPLSAINNAVKTTGLSANSEDRLWGQEVMERQVSHLARLIDDLMDTSRISRGKIRLEKVPVELAGSARRAVEAAMPLIRTRGHTLTVSIPDDLPPIEADPTRLEQMLGNLLTNAAKYTQDGGEIDLSARLDGDLIQVRVRDNGVGIAPEMLPLLFDLFTQGDRSLDRSEGGLGIGLTLVQKLAEMHGGSVSARSEGLGHGSEFTLTLPAMVGSSAREVPAARAPRDRSRGGLRVLVVDDNVDSATGLAKLLKGLGHKVRLVHDGPAAVDEALEYRPEVVLLDIGLPGMNGYQVAERLRAEPTLKNVLLVAVTGYGEEQAHRSSRAAGFDHHLVKPLDIDRVLDLMSQVAVVSNAG